MIGIDKNVPIPPRERIIRASKYPFADMQVGDSFFIALNSNNKKLSRSIPSSLHISVKKMGEDYKITVRKVKDGIRCWRTQ